MSEMCDLQIHINGQHTFFLSERIISKYCGKLRKTIKQERRKTQIRSSGISIADFPGGPHAFELISTFCYNNGALPITALNVSLLHCCANFLGMTEKASKSNLLQRTEDFLQQIFHWPWNDVVAALKSCEPFLDSAETCGLVERLMCSLLAKIAQNSDVKSLSLSSSSSSSSPDTSASPLASAGGRKWEWWFQDLTFLNPRIIHHFLKSLGSYGADNSNLVLTRFLLHYLKTSLHRDGARPVSPDYVGLAETAVYGVVLIGKSAFSCRGLFWVLKLVSRFGISRERRAALERVIGGVLDEAKLDDLLVCGGGGSNGGGVYDVNFVVRLMRVFVYNYGYGCENENEKKVKVKVSSSMSMSMEKMRRVGGLVDMYLGEIGPDPHLKTAKFLGVAESLPDSARDSFDQVYRAIDVFLQAHPSLSLEERSRVCRCLNYEKLSLEACKDLAKNPRIPPRIAIQALSSQGSNMQKTEFKTGDSDSDNKHCLSECKNYELALYKSDEASHDDETDSLSQDKEKMKTNLERMQWRVVELEKVCKEMKGQMAKMVKLAPHHNRPLPRFC